MVQYGFFFDENRCTGCQGCTIACKDWNHLPAGPVKWLRVLQAERGSFPNVRLRFTFAPCYHCENAPCISACPFDVIHRDEKFGSVLIDQDKCTSSGCVARPCAEACPYGAIMFESDDPACLPASKCDMCHSRLEKGDQPACVMSCYTRALDFGPIDELRKKYGSSTLPTKSNGIRPAIVFRSRQPKKKLVPYDESQALKILAKRPYGLPDVYNTEEDVTEIPPDLVGRSRFVMKPRNNEESMRVSMNDEG